MRITITVTPQAKHLLEQLLDTGLFGPTVDVVAGRLIDRALVEMVMPLKLEVVKGSSERARAIRPRR